MFLFLRGWKAVSVHGDKPQTERTKALSLFKNGLCPLMVVLYLSFNAHFHLVQLF